MTNFEKIKSMSIDELSEFIDEHAMYDDTPWMDWWDKTYCNKCESVCLNYEDCEQILGLTPLYNQKQEWAYCEVYHKCKYFPGYEEEPSMKDILKMWLETEEENHYE